ncbi:hypothetical protein [Methylorubrum extorquens]|uniref:hypothetical protein n=1 Tax=Methylorubrum TaxID=2282523 RepID=UPI00209D09C8|nr:hypothetical protein [Methylorubrum extorquens]MCP1535524.1 hypothetical protein [Methylorubrum extorquens]
MPSQRSASIPALNDHAFEPHAPCIFEGEHGDTVIRIADDWDGHVLIEKLYVALREARQAWDKAALLREAGPVRDEKLAERPLP